MMDADTRAALDDLHQRFVMAAKRMSHSAGVAALDGPRSGQVEAYMNAAQHVREVIAILSAQPAPLTAAEEVEDRKDARTLSEAYAALTQPAPADLVAKWRQRARLNTGDYRKVGIAQQQCADELDAILSAQPAPAGDPRGIQARSELNRLVDVVRFTPGQASGYLHSANDAAELLWRWAKKWWTLRAAQPAPAQDRAAIIEAIRQMAGAITRLEDNYDFFDEREKMSLTVDWLALKRAVAKILAAHAGLGGESA